MARILGTSIGKSSSILFLVLVIFISLALSKSWFMREGLDDTTSPIVSALVSDTTPAPAATVTPTASSSSSSSPPPPPPVQTPDSVPTPVPAASSSSPSTSMTSTNNLADSIDQIVQKAVKDALTKCNLCK